MRTANLRLMLDAWVQTYPEEFQSTAKETVGQFLDSTATKDVLLRDFMLFVARAAPVESVPPPVESALPVSDEPRQDFLVGNTRCIFQSPPNSTARMREIITLRESIHNESYVGPRWL
jgi:hypothetical protein